MIYDLNGVASEPVRDARGTAAISTAGTNDRIICRKVFLGLGVVAVVFNIHA